MTPEESVVFTPQRGFSSRRASCRAAIPCLNSAVQISTQKPDGFYFFLLAAKQCSCKCANKRSCHSSYSPLLNSALCSRQYIKQHINRVIFHLTRGDFLLLPVHFLQQAPNGRKTSGVRIQQLI